MPKKLYENDDLELQYNRNPLCPFCGHEQETTDLHEMLDREHDVLDTDCDSCSEEMTIERDIDIRYTTSAK